jgi:hypothetical protein
VVSFRSLLDEIQKDSRLLGCFRLARLNLQVAATHDRGRQLRRRSLLGSSVRLTQAILHRIGRRTVVPGLKAGFGGSIAAHVDLDQSRSQVRSRWQVRSSLAHVLSGAFVAYDIANNQLTGAALLGSVGLDWQLGGFAVDPPTVSGTFADMSNDQLVQAMAGFGGGSGAADGLNTELPNTDASQQSFLATSQHA